VRIFLTSLSDIFFKLFVFIFLINAIDSYYQLIVWKKYKKDIILLNFFEINRKERRVGGY
jgi:hypothetical protein